MSSYQKCMTNILNLSGRTSRWDFFIALIIMAVVTAIFGFLSTVAVIGFVFKIVVWIYGIISLVATITMTCRRLRDAGFPALLALLHFVPGAGQIVLLILCCFPSK